MIIRKELQKFLINLAFLALIILPMVGFRTTRFDFPRAMWIFSIFAVLLLINFLFRIYRDTRPQLSHAKRSGPTFFEMAARRVPRSYAIAALILAAFIFPLLANNYMIDVGITCLIYVCLGLGLNIVVGLCGLLDLGYIAFYAVGAYSYSLLNLKLGVPFWAALPFGVVLGMTCGCLIGYPTLKMRGDYLAIVTLGFGEIIRLVLNNWNQLTAGPNGLFGMARPSVYYPAFQDGGIKFLLYQIKSLPALYYLILFLVALVIIGVRRLDNSRVGRAWIAIREDEVAAELSGVPTTLLKLLAYALGAGFASVAGAFFAAKLSYTNPSFFLFMESCIVLCIVVLGGVGSITGIIVAAFVLIAVPEIFRELESYRMLAFGAIMTIMMILKPEGLIPAERRKRELHEQIAGEAEE
jgi:branched-chain amino acid transport system permease protein